jgi:hypothetical protein
LNNSLPAEFTVDLAKPVPHHHDPHDGSWHRVVQTAQGPMVKGPRKKCPCKAYKLVTARQTKIQRGIMKSLRESGMVEMDSPLEGFSYWVKPENPES